jgi:hypothetical protein
MNFERGAAAGAVASQAGRDGDGRVEILEAWFEDEHGAPATSLENGRPCAFAARARFNAAVEDPLFGLTLENASRDHVLSASTLWSDPRPGRFEAGEEVRFRVRFDNVFAPGRYEATPAVALRGTGIAWLDRREAFASVLVTGPQTTDAIVQLPYEIALERVGGASRTEPVR